LHIKAYFPNYLFISLDFNQVSPSTFQWMPNAEGLVCFEARPAYVPDRLIEAIKKHVDKMNASRMRAYGAVLEPGLDPRSTPEIGFNTVLDVDLTTGERVQGLMRMLQW
jgi:transcription antitermination factor NusG